MKEVIKTPDIPVFEAIGGTGDTITTNGYAFFLNPFSSPSYFIGIRRGLHRLYVPATR
jgi:hypothetical protein